MGLDTDIASDGSSFFLYFPLKTSGALS